LLDDKSGEREEDEKGKFGASLESGPHFFLVKGHLLS
jgi:hypothetical protein